LLIEKGAEEISNIEQIPIKEEITLKEQISKYFSDYSESEMVEELAKILAILYKQSNREFESYDKVSYETTLGLIRNIGEKLKLMFCKFKYKYSI
jgi:hypothetical protein